MFGLTEERVRALMTLAGFSIYKVWELPNGYWPKVDHYRGIRESNPWWLVMTDIGPIEIGYRKRVISINWEACSFGRLPVRGIVTEDDVTKDTTYVHAYTDEKALEYLKALRQVAFQRASGTS